MKNFRTYVNIFKEYYKSRKLRINSFIASCISILIFLVIFIILICITKPRPFSQRENDYYMHVATALEETINKEIDMASIDKIHIKSGHEIEIIPKDNSKSSMVFTFSDSEITYTQTNIAPFHFTVLFLIFSFLLIFSLIFFFVEIFLFSRDFKIFCSCQNKD